MILALAGVQGSLKWVDNFGIQILIYVMLAWGLNIVVGLAGLLDLGYVAFYAVGAYSYALLAVQFGEFFGAWSFWALLPIGGILAAFWGVILGFPVLRLRGDYLAIVTLAFGEIIRNVINCLYISLDGSKLHVAFNNPNVAGKLLINGPAGATGVSKIATFGMGFALVLFTLFVVLT